MRKRTSLIIEPVNKKWLAKKEAMKYLGCGEDYLTKLRNDASISFSMDGKMIWYDINSIDRFIERHRVI